MPNDNDYWLIAPRAFCQPGSDERATIALPLIFREDCDRRERHCRRSADGDRRKQDVPDDLTLANRHKRDYGGQIGRITQGANKPGFLWLAKGERMDPAHGVIIRREFFAHRNGR